MRQDPWSVVATPASPQFQECIKTLLAAPPPLNQRASERLPAPKKKKPAKRKTAPEKEEEEAESTEDPQDDDDDEKRACWSSLPPKEADWIEGLLNGGAQTRLSVLPCMKEKKLMPIEVTNILNARRGKIEFYANIHHAPVCPRYVIIGGGGLFRWGSNRWSRHLVLGNKIHCHSMEDKLVAICITEQINTKKCAGDSDAYVEVVRLFVRCFSMKCEVRWLRYS